MFFARFCAWSRRSRLAIYFLAVISQLSFAVAAEVEVKLNRDSVPAGEAAILTLNVTGGQPANPVVPPVDDLIVQQRGRSQKMQIFNGATSMSVEFTYVVGSNTPGDYVIPAIEVAVDGEKLTTQPLKLRVLDAGASQPPSGFAGGNPPVRQQGDEDGQADENRFGFLTVELADSDRKHVYVGEIAPVRIRAWLPADSQAQLKSGVQPEGKAFTLHNVSEQPRQSREMRDGKAYTVVTWFGGISATKSGKYPVSLSLDAIVAVRDHSAPKPQRQRGGPFGDPFFDSVFDQMNTPIIQKDVQLTSEDEEIEVLPLPVEGRPEGFSGAVGTFKLQGYDIPQNWSSGEPKEVMAEITGSGNFALLNAPELSPGENWKTYPGKSDFAAGDQTSFSGQKRFRFSAVPRKGGGQNVALKFSYFDPETAAYQTVESPPRAIEVAGGDLVEDVEPSAEEPPNVEEKKSAVLIGQHTRLEPAATLVPLVSRPAFVPILAASILTGLLGAAVGWIRRLRGDPMRLATAAMERATRDAVEAAGKCVAERDVSGFFSAARLAIQQRLGLMWNQPAQAITSAEVLSRLPGESPVVRFFLEADMHEYNRMSAGEIQPQWRALFDEALASLTPSNR